MREKKSMSLDDLSMYIDDLKRMGFVSEYVKNGQKYYELTELGIKSGLDGHLKN